MQIPDPDQPFRMGDAVIDPMGNQISHGTETCHITSREMDVLMCLVQSESAVVSRQQLLDSVWQGVVVNDDALTLTVSRLRRALADDPRHPRYIETIPTRGYRLMAPVVLHPRPRSVQGDVSLNPATPAKKQKSRTTRGYKIAMSAAVLLLAIFAFLFFRVRSIYGDLSTSAPRSTQSSELSVAE
jgi:DNA-binding winged helix-turn-helix (wHTH) protein